MTIPTTEKATPYSDIFIVIWLHDLCGNKGGGWKREIDIGDSSEAQWLEGVAQGHQIMSSNPTHAS